MPRFSLPGIFLARAFQFCCAAHMQGEASTPTCCQDVFTGWCLQALHLGGTRCALFVFLGTHLGLKNSFLVLAAQAPGYQLSWPETSVLAIVKDSHFDVLSTANVVGSTS